MCFSTRTECTSCKGAKVIGEELPEFEVVSEHFLIELPVSELSPLTVTWQFIVTLILLGLVGTPCWRREKELLRSVALHHRHWLSLGRTGEGGNTAGKGESKSSNLEDRATASNLKYFWAILEAVFCLFKEHYRRKKSEHKDEYYLSAWVPACAW